LTYLYKAQLWLAHENYKFYALRLLYLMIIKKQKALTHCFSWYACILLDKKLKISNLQLPCY